MASDQTDRAKLREAVHFVCKKMALRTDKLGAVKLQKIIWYFDVKSYLLTKKTATGTTFVKREFGPYSEEIGEVVKELVAADRLYTDTEDFYGNEKARFIGKGQTDLSLFSEKEKRWLDQISTEVCENHTADSISERTHGAIWRMAAYGEPIPFAATAVLLRAPSDEAIDAVRRDLRLP
jgi:Protein of unknown function (DUF4065)